MSEHLVAIVSFEGALKREVKRLREALRKVEKISEFRFTAMAAGRVHEGDVKITFSLCPNSFGGNMVEGDGAQAVLDEMLRRYGWDAVHRAKALTYEKIPSEDSDDGIPF